ncbi:MAG TPA: glutathione S-transferase family protein [Noviherbaspirillum sp.]|nr:glutathione S-transferase family protein [Noviherbaspirillum sp.]
MKPTLISHALCPYVQRAAITLAEKGIAFERIDIDLRAKPDWFLALSPLGKTPVLQVGPHAVFESAVICEYLEDTAGPALHPADPLERAQHRAWIEFASATLNTIWAFYTARDQAGYDAAAQTLADRFTQLERALGDGPYFAGARFCLVDAAFGPAFRYFDVFDAASGVDPMTATPKVRAWRNALAQRASVRQAVAADYPQRLAEFVIAQRGVMGERLRAYA